MDTIQGNKLIAEFMGYKYHHHPDSFALPGWKIPSGKKIPEKFMNSGKIGIRPYLGRTTKDLLFHSSWDWQIPAWSKVAKSMKDLLPKLSDIEEQAMRYFRMETNRKFSVLNEATTTDPFYEIGSGVIRVYPLTPPCSEVTVDYLSTPTLS